MIYEQGLSILKRLYRATVAKSITWSKSDDDDWYSCTLGGQEIICRFLYFEATNQVGADRHILEFMMPGCNARFACGTEGFDLLLEILAEAFDWPRWDRSDAIVFLDDHLPNV